MGALCTEIYRQEFSLGQAVSQSKDVSGLVHAGGHPGGGDRPDDGGIHGQDISGEMCALRSRGTRDAVRIHPPSGTRIRASWEPDSRSALSAIWSSPTFSGSEVRSSPSIRPVTSMHASSQDARRRASS